MRWPTTPTPEWNVLSCIIADSSDDDVEFYNFFVSTRPFAIDITFTISAIHRELRNKRHCSIIVFRFSSYFFFYESILFLSISLLSILIFLSRFCRLNVDAIKQWRLACTNSYIEHKAKFRGKKKTTTSSTYILSVVWQSEPISNQFGNYTHEISVCSFMRNNCSGYTSLAYD